MRATQLAFLSLVLTLPISLSPANAVGSGSFELAKEVPLWLVINLRDYNTGMPVSNISVSLSIYTDLGFRTIDSVLTNETGTIQAFLGHVDPETSFGERRLQEIELGKNYTLIKVQNVFVEDESWSTRDYRAEYVSNFTRHRGLEIELDYVNLKNRHLIEGNIWVLKGDLVRVLDSNPVTGEKETLFAAPAFKTNIRNERSQYETYYFFPFDYEVTIFHKVRTWTDYEAVKTEGKEEIYSPHTVMVDKNTTLVSWMSHAAEEYIAREAFYMDREMEWLSSAGYPLDRENEEYRAIKSLLERVLQLYRKEAYLSAIGGAKIADEKLSGLKLWLSNLKTLAVLTAAGISLFAYGLASLLSSFVFEESSQNRIRLVTKVAAFSLLMLMFSLTHPSLKITFAYLIGSRSIGLPMSLLGCFMIGGLTYLIIQLFSIRKKTMADLSVQLGVRSLKRRRSRTLLTLTTITIMVSSAIVFVNITMSRSTRIKAQWEGTDIPSVLVRPNTFFAPLSEYDVNWTRAQVWCENLAYTEGIRFNETVPPYNIQRSGMITLGDRTPFVNIVGIDPVFIEKYYNLSERVTGFWQEFEMGKPVAIIPSTFGILVNEKVRLAVREIWQPQGPGPPIIRVRDFGEFRVIGTFDPKTSFVNLAKTDNTPLFNRPSELVLIPLKSVISPVITISEITILLEGGYEPMDVAEELAYTLASPTVANKDGVARRIEWSLELSVTGLIPYLPPLIIAGLMMYTTMVSVYEERKKEYSTLATLGLDPKNTFQVFLVEALLLGLMGTFLGFFGSYILGAALFYLTSFLGVQGVPLFPLSSAHWSMPAILVALLAGVVMVFLGGYIPAVRAQGLSLMGRVKKRYLVGELISEGNITTFTLPIRETVQNAEMLYTYLRETVGKFKPSLIDSHSIKGEIYRDGSFNVSFYAVGEGSVTVPCEIKGAREGETLIPIIEFPTSYQNYSRIREILRDLEEYMIGFSAWKEMQLKMQIVREAPKKSKTIEQILTEIEDVISQVKDCNRKLKILDSQRGKLSEEVYNEFKQKYLEMIDEKSKNLRSMTVNLEPYHKELNEEIDKISVEVERITMSYNLGEVTEEEYVKSCGPLQARLTMLKGKVKELEEIFEFLKKPSRLA